MAAALCPKCTLAQVWGRVARAMVSSVYVIHCSAVERFENQRLRPPPHRRTDDQARADKHYVLDDVLAL